MRGEPSSDEARPDHTVAVLGYGQLREPTNCLEAIDGVRSFTPDEPEAPLPHTHGGATVERRSAADGGVITDPVDRAVEHGPVALVTTDLASAGSAPTQALDRITTTETTGIAVVAFPAAGEPAGPKPHESIERLRNAADATIVIREADRESELRELTRALVDVMATSGFVNLDLADIRTVLSAGPYAVVTSGTASSHDGDTPSAVMAVENALDSIRTARVEANLIYLVGGPTMTLDAGMAAVEALAEVTGDSSTIIWGAAIEEQREPVTAHIVTGIADDEWLEADLDAAAALTPDAPCPRCGGRVVGYSFGDSETQACDDCGYTGIAASRG